MISIFFFFLSFLSNASQQPVSFPQFYFEENHQLPLVYFEFVFDGGYVTDPADRKGLTQLSSQLFLKGTQKKTNKDFHTALNRLGGHLEVDIKSEGVLLEGAVLSENVGSFLALVEELLTTPLLGQHDFEQLKKEIQSSLLEKKSNDRMNAQDAFDKAFFGNHPYGNPESGTASGLNKISLKEAQIKVRETFDPAHMRLFGSGDASKEKIEAWFNRMQNHSLKNNRVGILHQKITAPTVQKGKRIFLVHKPNATQSQILLGGSGIRPENTGFYPILLANHAFGGGTFQSRLMQELRVKRGWTYGAFNQFQNGRFPKYFQMHVFPKTQDTLPSIQLMLSLLKQWSREGITKEEFQFSQQSLIKNAPFQFDTAKKRLQNLTAEYLKDYPIGFYQRLSQNMAQVQFDNVQKSLSEHLDTENLTLVILGDATQLKNGLKNIEGFTIVSEKNYLDE